MQNIKGAKVYSAVFYSTFLKPKWEYLFTFRPKFHATFIFPIEFEAWKADTEDKEGCLFVKVTGVLFEKNANLEKCYNDISIYSHVTLLKNRYRKI